MFAALQELLISRDCLGGFSDGNLKPVLDSVFSLEVQGVSKKLPFVKIGLGKYYC